MAEIDASGSGEKYLADMKASKARPAVAKVALASLRASLPSTLIFAFEGVEDKAIYFNWIGRVASNLRYEPLCCSGKTQLLELLEVTRRDLNNLGDGVYFFMDRDFDDLRSHDPSPNLFMTMQYSIENYLVSSRVLEEILKNEFHCHAKPELRAPILALFNEIYDNFLTLMRPANWRLFQARMIPIELTAPLPDKVSKFVNVSLNTTTLNNDHVPEAVVRMQRTATEQEAADLNKMFDALDPRKRFRGKFALLFFMKWLRILAEDRNARDSKYFCGVDNLSKANPNELTMGSLAAKSDLPEGLDDFLQSIPAMAG